VTRSIRLLVVAVGFSALGACGGETEEGDNAEAVAVDVASNVDVGELIDVSLAIPAATVSERLSALSELGVEATETSFGESFRLDMDTPSLGPNSGTYLTLLDTTHSTHSSGGYATLLPPYERTMFGTTRTVLPRVILRMNPRNYVRLVECGGNGPDILKFVLSQGSALAEPITESVVTSTNGLWFFAVPASNLTGFPNSMYLTISQDPNNPPAGNPKDVRFTGCDITAVN
jgi:hypothetical protein